MDERGEEGGIATGFFVILVVRAFGATRALGSWGLGRGGP